MNRSEDSPYIGHSTLQIGGRVTDLRQSLISWYEREGRQLPWRETKDPYKIWVSEIILQQTQVAQGLGYYDRFIERFPCVRSLAQAPTEELLLIWQGLGYYSRAHNMQAAAQQIVQEHGGKFPRDEASIAKLKGIGPYTTAAIMSIAYNAPKAVVDGNVYRVLSRIEAERTPIDTTQGQKLFRELADYFLDKRMPGIYNQAMMDLGAMICTPKKPKCTDCPLLDLCSSALSPKVETLPVKSKRTLVKNEYLDFFLLRHSDLFALEQRDNRGIWKGLYQLPLHTNTESHPDAEGLKAFLLSLTGQVLVPSETFHYTHKLSHRLLSIRIHLIPPLQSPLLSTTGASLIWAPIEDHASYAMPKPLRAFMDKHLSSLLSF